MNKRVKIVLLSLTAALVILFVTILLLALPIRTTGTIPMIALYVTGTVAAAIFLAGAIVSIIYPFLRLTRRGEKYYDKWKTSEEEDEGSRK